MTNKNAETKGGFTTVVALPSLPSDLNPTQALVNGGVLVRAAKVCNCKKPEMQINGIQEDDEWTCSCGQGWRARDAKEGTGLYWRRISKRDGTKKKSATT